MKKKTLWIALLSTLCAVTLTAAACSGNTGGGSNRKPEKYSQLDAPNDPDIVIDGKLDDAVYGNELNWLTNTYRQNVSGNMPVLQYTGFTTSYGIYVAGKVTDSNICWQDRGGWAPAVNSTWDINFVVDKKGEAPLTERHNRNRFQTDVKGEDVYASISCPRVRYATSVEGELNSRKTTSASIELFVPWSQFGFTQEEIPDDFGIVMQYLAVLGTNQSTTWLSMMTNIDESENYFRVDQNGYTNPDGEDAVLGNSKFGVARSAGWDLSREAEGIVQCVGGRSDQTIFFKDAYADNYSVKTAIVPIESVHKDTPQVGFLMMNAQEYYYNVTLNLWNENLTAGDNGTKKIKDIELYATQNMPVWSRRVMKEKRANAQADDKDLTLEVVKKGAKIYVFVNDEFITMKEVPFVAGNLMVGLQAIGMNTIFKDYAFNAMSASGAETRLNELGVYSVEAEVLTVGGNAEVDADRENPQVRFTAQSGYELDRVTQNGTDITDDVKANAESGVYTLEGLSSPALLQVSYKQIAPENAATYSGKITFAGSGVLGKLSLTNSAIPYACYEQISNPDGTFNVVLPKGEWGVRAVYQDVWVSEKSVNLTDDVTSDTIECASAQLGAWSSVTIPDVQTANDFAIFAKTESAGVSYFNEAGILVKVGGVNYGFLFGNDKLVLRNWNDPGDIPLVWQVNPTDMNAADFTCGLSFNGERYTAYINGAAVREITAYDLGAKIDKYTDLFGNKAKAIGFITRVSPVNYSEFDYAVTADEVSELLTQKNITFDYKNVTLKYIDGEATESNTSAMGVATLAAERVLPYGNVVLTVKPNAGHMVVSVKKNGVEIMQSLVHTKDGYAVTLTSVTEDTALVVGFAEEVPVYTVTGAYDYAEGLYSAGDRVTVKSGLYEGIVNVADKTYTIDIPEGERQITVSGLLYQDVTVTVTVTTEGATAQKATFDRVKLESHFDGGSITPTAGGYSFGTFTLAKFCGVTATDKFYIETTVKFDNNGALEANQMPGFLVYSGEEFAIFPYFHGGELDFVIRRWNGADITLETNIPFTENTSDGVRIALAFRDGTYTVLVNGNACCEITQEKADANSAKFFESNTEKRFGLLTRARGAEFSDIAYTLDAAAIEAEVNKTTNAT